MTTRFGVDVGGTFTDCVLYDEASGTVYVDKAPTVPAAPEAGVLAVVRDGVPAATLAQAELFLHGTTVGINALLERNGARVGLLTTRGFRDVLEMRRGERDALYDITWTPPPPLVPRRFRLPVTERIAASGAIEIPLDGADIERNLAVFSNGEIEAIAIVFINAYANPIHEQAAERILRDQGFTGEISLSSAVSGEYREYERTSTTVVDAYVRPKVSGYLARLERELITAGFAGASLITRSGGGAMSFAQASGRPVDTIMSGPVAGAAGAAGLCRRLQIDQAITADVGGTSFDTCLIVDGQPQLKFEGVVDGMPLQLPWIDVRSIGAGGGSIAYMDEGGLLRVGPRSAGSRPGPACYDRGGTLATVTDAAAVLGMLGHGELAGGVQLAFAQAESAVEALSDPLRLSVTDTAAGIITIATAAMADAVRSVTVEQGYDPRAGVLIAFGGAGPLFAGLLAHELEVGRVLVPNYAGNFSAWGLLAEDVLTTAARTMLSKLDQHALQRAQQMLDGLVAGLRDGDGDADGGRSAVEAALELRYAGQEYSLPVAVAVQDGRLAASPDELGQTFESTYERVFGYRLGEPIELVAIRAGLRTPLPQRVYGTPAAPRGWRCNTDPVRAYSFASREPAVFGVVDRLALGDGDTVRGPSIVLEPTATTYIDAGWQGRVLEGGVLELVLEAGA